MRLEAGVAPLEDLRPVWRGLPEGVGAAMSSKAGGVSRAPWASLNLGRAVGDDADAVAENRARFVQGIGAEPVWLRQVHGVHVVKLETSDEVDEPADAAWTDRPGIACTVMTADCLPVLFATRDGRAVAAAHAGWRGLAAGVLEATVDALSAGHGVDADHITAYLGPCIGPRQFEVGADVVEAFPESPAAFTTRPRPDGQMRWLADMPMLARARLASRGVVDVFGGDVCTVEDPARWFSYRRDGVTGRMAAAIWLQAR